MVKKVVLFNGPPRCGKDTYANELLKYVPSAKIFHLAEVLKNTTHQTYGLYDIPYNYFEDVKDFPVDEFYGKSPRECYIQMSESYLKPLHGNNFFIKKAVDMIEKSNDDFWIIPDCGFDEEVKFLSNCENLKCVYVILSREGKNFDFDSRKYIDTDLINMKKDSYFYKFIEENMIPENGEDIYNKINNLF